MGSASIFATGTDTEGLGPGEIHGGWSASGFGFGDAVIIAAKAGRTFLEGEHGVSFSRVLVVQDVSIETRSVGGQITNVVWFAVRNAGTQHVPVYTVTLAKVSP